MTYAQAHTTAMAALEAVSRAGQTTAQNPGREATLRHALNAAQSAMDALASAEQGTPPVEGPKLLELQARWAKVLGHWENNLRLTAAKHAGQPTLKHPSPPGAPPERPRPPGRGARLRQA
jgi:hypothetical protein